MARIFRTQGSEEGIMVALEMTKSPQGMAMPIIEALEIRHVVMGWVLDQKPSVVKELSSVKTATGENISALNELWELCARHGIQLGKEQKIALYQDFLDD
jgi:hypothetical protein